jgi:septum formation protein
LFLKSENRLILASTSTYRRQLLERLGLAFSVAAPAVDETPLPDETPLALVRRLARAKAAIIARANPGTWVIGSDQAAVRGRSILGKPLSQERCIEQLSESAGRRVKFLTAVALLRSGPDKPFEAIDTTWVSFRDLDAATIQRYVEREKPFDCAGGFKSEGLGITLFDAIDCSDPTALIGLPLIAVSILLRRAGFILP